MIDRDAAYGIVIADLRARRREIDRTIAMLAHVRDEAEGVIAPTVAPKAVQRRFWTPERHRELVRMKLAGLAWAEIATVLGARSANTCCVQYYHLKRERLLDGIVAELAVTSPEPKPIPSRIASPADMERMLICRRPGCRRRKRRSGFCDMHEPVAEGVYA